MGSRHDDHRSSRGSRGERGERGHSGHNGRDGKDGAPGETGPAGKDGAKGERGEAGDTIVVLNPGSGVLGVVLPLPGKLKNWILVATPFPFDVTFNLLVNDKQALSLILKKGEKRVSEKKDYVRADEGDVIRLETPGVHVSGFLSSILLEAK